MVTSPLPATTALLVFAQTPVVTCRQEVALLAVVATLLVTAAGAASEEEAVAVVAATPCVWVAVWVVWTWFVFAGWETAALVAAWLLVVVAARCAVVELWTWLLVHVAVWVAVVYTACGWAAVVGATELAAWVADETQLDVLAVSAAELIVDAGAAALETVVVVEVGAVVVAATEAAGAVALVVVGDVWLPLAVWLVFACVVVVVADLAWVVAADADAADVA